MIETSAVERLLSASYASVPQVSENHSSLGDAWVIPLTQLQAAKERTLSLRYSIIKRVIDIVFSSVLLLLLLPIGLVIGSCVLFSSPGPVFFREMRMGRFGRSFTILKFRSMHTKEYLREVMHMRLTENDLAHLRTFSKPGVDPRATGIGLLIRKWSLDELPQLINVLRGDMSLVGPRPVVTAERELYGASAELYDMAAPGITGLWQVSGRNDLSFRQRVSLDCTYVSEWRLLLDLAVLAKTIPAVLQRKGAY